MRIEIEAAVGELFWSGLGAAVGTSAVAVFALLIRWAWRGVVWRSAYTKDGAPKPGKSRLWRAHLNARLDSAHGELNRIATAVESIADDSRQREMRR